MTIKRDPFEDLYARVKSLQAQIDKIRNNATPTVPLYDPAQFPIDAIEGQIALGTDDKAYKYLNGAWTQLSSGGGIQFDTYPQAGGNLYIETNYSTTPPWYPGGDVHTRFPSMPSAIYTNGGTLFVGADGAGFSVWTDGAEIDLYADRNNSGVIRFNSWQWFADIQSEIEFHADGFISMDAGDVGIFATSGGLTLSSGTNFSLSANNTTAHDIRFNLNPSAVGAAPAGVLFVVTDTGQVFAVGKQINPAAFTLLFRIDTDGSIHTKSGVTSFTDDL